MWSTNSKQYDQSFYTPNRQPSHWVLSNIWVCYVFTTNHRFAFICICDFSTFVNEVLCWNAESWQMLPHMQQWEVDRGHGRHLESMTSYLKSVSINRCIFTWRSILPNFILIWFEMTEHWAFLSALPQQEGKISRDTRSVPDPKCTFLISILSTLFNTNNNKVFSELWPLLLYLLHNRICLNNSKDVPPSQNNESVAANMFNCFIKTTIFNNICQKNTLWRQNHYRNMHGLC